MAPSGTSSCVCLVYAYGWGAHVRGCALPRGGRMRRRLQQLQGQTDRSLVVNSWRSRDLLQSPLPAGGASGVVARTDRTSTSATPPLYRVRFWRMRPRLCRRPVSEVDWRSGGHGGLGPPHVRQRDSRRPHRAERQRPVLRGVAGGLQPSAVQADPRRRRRERLLRGDFADGRTRAHLAVEPTTNSAGEMPGVGMPETGARGTNLYSGGSRGDRLVDNIDGPAAGIYITDVLTGVRDNSPAPRIRPIRRSPRR